MAEHWKDLSCYHSLAQYHQLMNSTLQQEPVRCRGELISLKIHADTQILWLDKTPGQVVRIHIKHFTLMKVNSPQTISSHVLF